MLGCFVMAINVSNECDKLNPRGMPCVFLGYPQTKKGYELLDLTTNKLFISRNVKFYEIIYPYRLFHKNSLKESQNLHDPNFTISDLCYDDDHHVVEEVAHVVTDETIPDTTT